MVQSSIHACGCNKSYAHDSASCPHCTASFGSFTQIARAHLLRTHIPNQRIHQFDLNLSSPPPSPPLATLVSTFRRKHPNRLTCILESVSFFQFSQRSSSSPQQRPSDKQSEKNARDFSGGVVTEQESREGGFARSSPMKWDKKACPD
jgi:hypothetical protein